MQLKLTILNSILALASMAVAGLAVMIWVEPKFPSKVDPATIQPEPKVMESVKIERPYLSRADVNPIATSNIFRKERREYTPPPPPKVASAVATTSAPKAPVLPPPKVSLKGVFISGETRVAFLEGKFPVSMQGKNVKEKDVKRKGYRLGERLGGYKINRIEKNRITMANNHGSQMTLRLAKRSPKDAIKRKGSHFTHRDKNARKQNNVEVEKVKRVSNSSRRKSSRNASRRSANRPRTVTRPPQINPGTNTRFTQMPPGFNPTPPPANLRTFNPPRVPRATSPAQRISGAATSPPLPTGAAPHISGAVR